VLVKFGNKNSCLLAFVASTASWQIVLRRFHL